MEVREIVLVNGCGCLITHDMKHYLATVLAYIQKHHARIGYVIVSGGFTNKALPEMSEADCMGNFLESQQIGVPVIRDRDAYSTIENLKNTTRIIREATTVRAALEGKILPYILDRPWQMTVFCRDVAAPKVRFLAPKIIPRRKRARVKVLSVNFSTPLLKMGALAVAGTAITLAEFYLPALAKIKRVLRNASLNEGRFLLEKTEQKK